MSRPFLIAALATALGILTLAVVWFVVLQPQTEPAPTASDDRRQRAEDFLGGDPDRSVRGGQEMKPRW